MELTSGGEVRLELGRSYDDGTTHLIFEPLDFISRLAALVPPPRSHLVRYHGVLAPNAHWRGDVLQMTARHEQRSAPPSPEEPFKAASSLAPYLD